MATFEEGLNLDADVFRLSEYLYRDNVKVWKKNTEGWQNPFNQGIHQ
ncbi:hypothetical protein OL548_18775 [Lysinibacillus sp. MHQ-1]|nr:hypothetical protein OL548_18775 [Lysinibacillus sp. MHQ-1]